MRMIRFTELTKIERVVDIELEYSALRHITNTMLMLSQECLYYRKDAVKEIDFFFQ
jgi:hypothetical protein